MLSLSDLLVLLAFSVVVVATFRRLQLPPILGYLAVGMVVGPYALNLLARDETTRVLSELGVVFLVFTLGLEFSLPRMVAMRREVLGVGGAQVTITTLLFGGTAMLFAVDPLAAIVCGGALAMSSTAIVIRQLTEQFELHRTHSRLAIGILLFQDLAFVPLLALESALAAGTEEFDGWMIAGAVLRAAIALAIVLTLGRWLLRPLFHEIGRARSTELFTLAALLVSLGAAVATEAVGLSMALGAFLAGMLLAETEYRHQLESVIRPFRDILLGLFFITVGAQLDLSLLFNKLWLVLLLVVVLQVVKAGVVLMVAKRFAGEARRALRTGLVTAQGGEFGFALLTLMSNDNLADASIIQPLLAATVVGMAMSPFLIRYNGRIADFLLREREREASELEVEIAATRHTAQREHVVVCGFGRVGQNLARVLERQGFEYLALDLDPRRVREARQAGDPVIYGDATQPEVLEAVGLLHCKVFVITFSDPDVALGILRAVRDLRPEVPILVRTQDDKSLDALQLAGATEVVPETLEASLMLVSHVLLLLGLPVSRVLKTVSDIRNDRYSILRRLFWRDDPRVTESLHEELHTVALPPGAYAVGKALGDLHLEEAEIAVTAVRRDGIVGRQPGAETVLREGDVVVLFGTREALERGEALLLMG